jgi:hypothetical protein
VGRKNRAHVVLVGYVMEKGLLEDLDTDKRVILKCIFKKWNEA